MNITRGFLMMELAQERARRVSAERAVMAINEHDDQRARQMARAHDLGWMEPEREQVTASYPHETSDFCDDE
jgi:hypothetical protein